MVSFTCILALLKTECIKFHKIYVWFSTVFLSIGPPDTQQPVSKEDIVGSINDQKNPPETDQLSSEKGKYKILHNLGH